MFPEVSPRRGIRLLEPIDDLIEYEKDGDFKTPCKQVPDLGEVYLRCTSDERFYLDETCDRKNAMVLTNETIVITRIGDLYAQNFFAVDLWLRKIGMPLNPPMTAVLSTLDDQLSIEAVLENDEDELETDKLERFYANTHLWTNPSRRRKHQLLFVPKDKSVISRLQVAFK